MFVASTRGTGRITVTDLAGVAHCALSPRGARVVCDIATGRGLLAWDLSGAMVTGPMTLVADPTGLGATDPDYASCAITSADFPSFCDDTHVALSVSCVTPRTGITFSKLFMATLDGATAVLQPLGASLAARFGGPGRTSWTPSCRVDA